MSAALTVWRHPRPEGVKGRCIGGRSDVPVHWRRAKRLARRIQAHARRVDDFLHFAPPGGESLAALLARVEACELPEGALAVSHGGWMLARQWLRQSPGQVPDARSWPRPPRYGESAIHPRR